MKRVLIVSFDLISPGEPVVSLSIATLLAFLRANPAHLKAYAIDHISINLVTDRDATPEGVYQQLTRSCRLQDIDCIALSCYVWSEYLINSLIAILRQNGFAGRILLGGYQIEYSDFLELCAATNAHLEFGLQTAIPEEFKPLNRVNDLKHVAEVIERLNRQGISFEVSLIYGLPNQTVSSFSRSLDFLQTRGCRTIKAYPLMLLKGTALWRDRNSWQLQEEESGSHHIPVVTSSSSFDKTSWNEMREIANGLAQSERY